MASACSPRASRRIADGETRHVRRASSSARAAAVIRPGPKQGRHPEGAWITAARGGAVPSRPWLHGRTRRAAKVRSRRNGKTSKHRARPGRPAPSPTASQEAAMSHARSFSLPFMGRDGEAQPSLGGAPQSRTADARLPASPPGRFATTLPQVGGRTPKPLSLLTKPVLRPTTRDPISSGPGAFQRRGRLAFGGLPRVH